MDAFIVRRGNIVEQTGGGLNFEIVCGTTQPSSPTENMIWLKTEQEVASWSICKTDPTAGQEELYKDISLTSGSYLKSDGSLNANSDWRYTDNILLPNNTKTIIVTTGSTSSSTPCHVFYDASGVLLSSVLRKTGTNMIDVPEGAVSVKLSLNKSDVPSVIAKYTIEVGDGFVWIMHTDEIGAEFNALSENALMIAIGDAAQYVGGEWKNIHLHRYSNEEWLDWTAHIIKDGTTIYPSATVGMAWKEGTSYGGNNPQITQDDGFIQVSGSTTGYGMAYFGEFDLTGRTQIVLEGTFKVIESGYLYVWTSVGSYITETVVASAKYTATGATIDLSGNPLEGKHLIGIATQASYVQKITGLYVV